MINIHAVTNVCISICGVFLITTHSSHNVDMPICVADEALNYVRRLFDNFCFLLIFLLCIYIYIFFSQNIIKILIKLDEEERKREKRLPLLKDVGVFFFSFRFFRDLIMFNQI